MNSNYKEILLDVFGTMDINSNNGKFKLIADFNEYDRKFLELEELYSGEEYIDFRKNILECHLFISKLYKTIIMDTIHEFSENIYGQSIDFIITNTSQEELNSKIDKYLISKGYPDTFKTDVYSNIKLLAERLDKRFRFDEFALINLIEASSGNNISSEQGLSASVDCRYVVKDEKGYKYKTSKEANTVGNNTIYIKNRSTADGSILLNPNGPERLEIEKIQLQSFPLGNQFTSSTDDVMKKIMGHLFENLDLCIETYNSIYNCGNNVVNNTAHLADGTTFDFQYIINEKNIPHLFGIPNPKNGGLSQNSIDILNTFKSSFEKPLSLNSSSTDLLTFIYKHQNEIIALGGLFEENEKKYEILNWEKIILKTSSFMRGDFFKTCFCLAKLAQNKYLNDSSERGGYVSISSTAYNKGLNSSLTARSVLNDLMNTVRQKKDFIFRGFKTDNNGNQIINSIMTGKAETIRVGSNNELLKTLQRYRDLFLTGTVGSSMETTDVIYGNGGTPFDDPNRNKEELIGSIVEEVENEKFIKIFTPEEQAELGISISRDLFGVPTMSKDAIDLLQNIHEYNGAITLKEIDEFNDAKSNGHKK
ncbi:MAG: hypothetical protein RSF67_02895 [Clostridia bacterium]